MGYLRAEEILTDEDITVKYIGEMKYQFDELVSVGDLSLIFERTPQTIRKRIQDFPDGLVYQDRSYWLSPFAACFFYPPQKELYSRESHIPRQEVLEELLLSPEKDQEIVKLVTKGCSRVYGAAFFNLYDALHQRWALAMGNDEQRIELLGKKGIQKKQHPGTKRETEINGVSLETAMALVARIARKKARTLPPGTVDIDDLIGAGTLGMVDALQRYDSQAGPAGAFMSKRIFGEMMDYLRSLDYVSRESRQKLNRLKSAEERLCGPTGDVDESTLCQAMDITTEELGELRTLGSITHISEVINEKGEYAPITQFLSESGRSPEEIVGDVEEARIVLKKVRDREQQRNLQGGKSRIPWPELIMKRWGHDLTERTIGQDYGVSESRISQLLKKIKEELQELVNPG